jgi:hypothetical protein
MPDTPVPPTFDRITLRREVNAKVQRFLSGAASAVPEGGKAVTKPFRAVYRAIIGLAGQPGVLHTYNANNPRMQIGEAAAVCFLGSQQVILLRIYYRTGQETWQEYEYAFCEQKRGRTSSLAWTNARDFYRDLNKQQSAEAPPIEIDMATVRSTAQATLDRIKVGGHGYHPRGAKLTGTEVEDQIKGLKPTFTIGANDARNAPVGSYRAICFVSEATGLNLRVYRHDREGWLHATYALEVRYKRPNAQHRGRRGGQVEYTWR